jgi:hypothetical protein
MMSTRLERELEPAYQPLWAQPCSGDGLLEGLLFRIDEAHSDITAASDELRVARERLCYAGSQFAGRLASARA